ncbi:hypothetical protein Tco_1506942 [Tanacetum coccineum]
MSTHEQITNNPTSAVRNTRGRNGPQGLEEPMSDEVLREMCDKNYHQLLPLIAEKMKKEKEQKDKLNGTPTARTEPRRRRGDRYSRSPSPHASVFKRLKKYRSPSPRPRPRKEGGVFNRLGRKEPATSSRPDSRQRSPQAKRTEVEARRRQQKGTPSRTTSQYSESEDSEGGHRKSKSRRQKSNTYEDDLSQPWTCEERNPFTPRIWHFSLPRTRMPSHVKTYDGSGDSEDHLKLFQSPAKTEGWAMPTWCHMFNSTLTGNARGLTSTKESIDSYGEVGCTQSRSGKKSSSSWKPSKNDKPKAPKKGEASGKDKPLTILMIQPWERVAKPRITQSFSPETAMSFPPLSEEDGTESPMIIEVEMGGHFVHRVYIDGGASSEVLYEHCFVKLRKEIRDQMVPPPLTYRESSVETIVAAGQCLAIKIAKKRGHAPKRNKAIQEELKISDAGIIKKAIITVASQSDGSGVPLWVQKEAARKKKSSETKTETSRNPSTDKQEMKHPRNAVLNLAISENASSKDVQKLNSIFQWIPEAEEACQANEKAIAEHPTLTAPRERDELFINLAATKRNYQREGYEHPIQPRTAIKGQILADFIVERPKEESPDELMAEPEVLPEPWTLFTDGSSCVDGSGAGARGRIEGKVHKRKGNSLTVEEEGNTWMTPICEYLTKEILPEDTKKARAIWPTGRSYQDNGNQFCDNPLKIGVETLASANASLPEKPPSNGLVERANRRLEKE